MWAKHKGFSILSVDRYGNSWGGHPRWQYKVYDGNSIIKSSSRYYGCRFFCEEAAKKAIDEYIRDANRRN